MELHAHQRVEGLHESQRNVAIDYKCHVHYQIELGKAWLHPSYGCGTAGGFLLEIPQRPLQFLPLYIAVSLRRGPLLSSCLTLSPVRIAPPPPTAAQDASLSRWQPSFGPPSCAIRLPP